MTYNLARYVADIIQPLVGKSPYHLNNSQHLLEKLKDVKVKDDEILISFDVSALFTSVPVDETIEIIRKRLQEDPTLATRTTLQVEDIVQMLTCCLKTTYFSYQGEFYTQLEGAAMGSPVSPLVANIFMEEFEVKALKSFPHHIKFWARYVDDTGCVIKRHLVQDFANHLNTQHSAIKFTMEEEADGQLPMLDTLICRSADGALHFSVYRKPTHTDHYLQYDSHQPLQHKLGVIRTLKNRVTTHCSTPQAKAAEESHIKHVLSISGYTKWSWQVAQAKKKQNRAPPDKSTNKRKGYVVLPYCAGTSEALARKFRNAGVAAHHRPYMTTRRLIVAPKDPTPISDQAGVIYRINCQDCTSCYVGETERPLRIRTKEHHRDSSPVASHATTKRHSIDYEHIKVLEREPDWFRRGVKEAICIETTGADLNRDRGRHLLAPAYRRLLDPRPVSKNSNPDPRVESS